MCLCVLCANDFISLFLNDNQAEYIIDYNPKDGKYLVKWKDYDDHLCTWESYETIEKQWPNVLRAWENEHPRSKRSNGYNNNNNNKKHSHNHRNGNNSNNNSSNNNYRNSRHHGFTEDRYEHRENNVSSRMHMSHRGERVHRYTDRRKRGRERDRERERDRYRDKSNRHKNSHRTKFCNYFQHTVL